MLGREFEVHVLLRKGKSVSDMHISALVTLHLILRAEFTRLLRDKDRHVEVGMKFLPDVEDF